MDGNSEANPAGGLEAADLTAVVGLDRECAAADTDPRGGLAMNAGRERVGAKGRLAVLVGLVLLPAAAGAAAQIQGGVARSATPPPVALPGTHQLTITSAITGQAYDLHVNLPRGYEEGKAAFPVIYLLDSQWDFPLIQSIYGQQYYDGFLPAAIVVGITWGGDRPDYDRRRGFDLTPTPGPDPARFGNGARFLAFLEKEAIPFVESRYRAQQDERTLIGSSLGGLFTLYALFERPGLFNRLVLTSPAWNWDGGALSKHAERCSKGKLPRPTKLFMAVGEHEDVPGFERLGATIRGLNVAGLEMETRTIGGAGHSGAKAEGYTRGLQYAFARPCLALEASALERYVGEYELRPGARARIAVEDGRLVGYRMGGRAAFCADSPRDFHLVGQFLNLHFVESEDGTLTGFEVEEYNGNTFVKKVK
jgi:predicted alpha/beta superfamily hydrolase